MGSLYPVSYTHLIKVDSKGNAKIDKENIANLLQINMKPANEANKGKFE